MLAEYFDNAELQGPPKLTRVEDAPVSPGRSRHRRRLSGRSVARVFRALDGERSDLRVTGDVRVRGRGGGNGVRVFLDEKDLLPPNGRGHGPSPLSAPLLLDAGRTYAVRMEYRQAGTRPNGGNVQLMWVPPPEGLLAEAAAAARGSDVTLAFVGLNPSLEGEEMSVSAAGFAGGDRTTLDLPESQARLLDTLFATGKPVIVVLTSGSAVALNDADKRAAAVLAAWYGGEEIGTAIAETLTGENNPAGRLPVTFYRSVAQLPPFEDYSMNGRTYRYFVGDPLYGFGFGLSYATFRYSKLRIQRLVDGSARVTARVKNTSARDGDEVAQLYVSGGQTPGDPIRTLRGFQRLRLEAGEMREVEFSLAASALPKDEVRMSVGGGQPAGRVARVSGKLRAAPARGTARVASRPKR